MQTAAATLEAIAANVIPAIREIPMLAAVHCHQSITARQIRAPKTPHAVTQIAEMVEGMATEVATMAMAADMAMAAEGADISVPVFPATRAIRMMRAVLNSLMNQATPASRTLAAQMRSASTLAIAAAQCGNVCRTTLATLIHAAQIHSALTTVTATALDGTAFAVMATRTMATQAAPAQTATFVLAYAVALPPAIPTVPARAPTIVTIGLSAKAVS